MKYRVFDIDNKAEYTKEMSCADDGYSDMVREMVRTHKPCTDWGCVKIEGKWYYIMYVL